jgi:hypothetical protein
MMSVVEDTRRLLHVLVAFEEATQPVSMDALSRTLGWRSDKLETALDYGEAHGWIRSVAGPLSIARESVMLRDGGRRVIDDSDTVARWASAVASSR